MDFQSIEGNKYCFLGCQLLFIETVGNIIQPFAFIGYQEDEISGLKFAQARFYSAENGRFVGEDQVKGSIHSSLTLNRFIYCENSPIDFVDVNGEWLKPKEFNAYDGAAIGLMTVGTVAAAVGAIAIGAAVVASAPVSLPLIAAGAVIGGSIVSGAGAVMANGGASLETVGAAIYKNRHAITGTVGGVVSSVSGDVIRAYESNKKIDGEKLLKKGALTGLIQSGYGGFGGHLGNAFNSANPSGKEQFLFYLINDLTNQGLLDQAASIFIDYIYRDKNNENKYCEE